MLVALKFLVIILSISSGITAKFKFKQENSILITMLGIGILLYVLGLIGLMKIGIYIVIVLSIASVIYLIYKIIKKQIEIKEIFTVGTLLYSICIIGISFLLRNTYYTQWDEFSHWGSNLKAMVAYDVLWSSDLYDGVHVVYPPLAGIIEYFMCKINGGFTESVSYFAVDVFFITMLLPMLKDLKYKVKDITIGILCAFSAFCLINMFGFNLTSVYIDLLLAVLFGIGLYVSFKLENKEEKILLAAIIFSLAILKDTGLLFAGIILMQIGIRKVIYPTIKDRKINKNIMKKVGILLLVLVVMLGVYMSWKMYCSANGHVLDYRHDTNSIAKIDIVDFVKAVLQIKCEPGKLLDISNTFYDRLNNQPMIGGFNYPFNTTIQILVVLDIIGLVLYIVNKSENKKNISIYLITMNIGFILYCLLLMATFMFAFTEPEGRILASYERYMPTFFLAWIFSMIGIFIKVQDKHKLKTIIIISLVCLYGMNMRVLIKPVVHVGTSISEEIQNEGEIILNNVSSTKDKVYIIYQQSNGYEFHQLRYCISPIRTNLVCEWCLGEPTYEGFIWNYNITEEEFEKKLIEEQFDYVFVAKSDDNLTSKYGDIFDKEVDLTDIENKLFKVEKINNNVKLVEYKK